MSLVSTDWLYKNLDNVKIIDCSWHLPNQNRDSYNEFLRDADKKGVDFAHLGKAIAAWKASEFYNL